MDAARSKPSAPTKAEAARNRAAFDVFRGHVECALMADGKVRCIDAGDGTKSVPVEVTSIKGLTTLAFKLVSKHEFTREKRGLESLGDGDLFTDTELRLLLAETKLYTWRMEREVLELVAAVGGEDAQRDLRNHRRRFPTLCRCGGSDQENDRADGGPNK